MQIPKSSAQSEFFKAEKLLQQLQRQQGSANGVAIDAAMSHHTHSQHEVDMIAWRY